MVLLGAVRFGNRVGHEDLRALALLEDHGGGGRGAVRFVQLRVRRVGRVRARVLFPDAER